MWETGENTGFRFENLTESRFKAAIHQRIFAVFSYHLFLDPFLFGFFVALFSDFFCFFLFIFFNLISCKHVRNWRTGSYALAVIIHIALKNIFSFFFLHFSFHFRSSYMIYFIYH